MTFLLQAAGGGPQWGFMMMMLAIFAVMYFFMIRPQRKKEKELQKLREGLKKNDDIVTAGGIHGKIAEVQESTVVITTEGVGKLKVDKGSIAVINGVAGAPKR